MSAARSERLMAMRGTTAMTCWFSLWIAHILSFEMPTSREPMRSPFESLMGSKEEMSVSPGSSHSAKTDLHEESWDCMDGWGGEPLAFLPLASVMLVETRAAP